MLLSAVNPDTGDRAAGKPRVGRLFLAILLAWLATLGFDFFLHAGLLARLYLEPSPFLLPPREAFARIPFGYLSFLFLAILLLWLMARLRVVAGWRAGCGFGLRLGALVWGSLALGLYSVSMADPALLAGWFAGQTLELGLAGAVAGSALSGSNIGRLALKVVALVLLFAIITIVMQNVGLAPAAERPA